MQADIVVIIGWYGENIPINSLGIAFIIKDIYISTIPVIIKNRYLTRLSNINFKVLCIAELKSYLFKTKIKPDGNNRTNNNIQI